MKKELILLSTALTLMTSGQVWAAACATPPDCASLGYTMNDSECGGKTALKCPTDPSKVWCDKPADTGLQPGDILYSDMTTSPLIVKGKKPIGVVYSAVQRMAISLDEATKSWGNGSKPYGLLGTGKARTKILYDLYGSKAPAAEYCYTYKTEGTNPGDWFIPSAYEISQTRYNEFRLLECSWQIVVGGVNRPLTGTCYERDFILATSNLPLPTECNQQKLFCLSTYSMCTTDYTPLTCKVIKAKATDINLVKTFNARAKVNETIFKLELLQLTSRSYWTSTSDGIQVMTTDFNNSSFIGTPDESEHITENMYPTSENKVRCFIKF